MNGISHACTLKLPSSCGRSSIFPRINSVQIFLNTSVSLLRMLATIESFPFVPVNDTGIPYSRAFCVIYFISCLVTLWSDVQTASPDARQLFTSDFMLTAPGLISVRSVLFTGFACFSRCLFARICRSRPIKSTPFSSRCEPVSAAFNVSCTVAPATSSLMFMSIPPYTSCPIRMLASYFVRLLTGISVRLFFRASFFR